MPTEILTFEQIQEPLPERKRFSDEVMARKREVIRKALIEAFLAKDEKI